MYLPNCLKHRCRVQCIILVYGTMSAFRGYCFSILNNRMTMRLR
jgi:hypothetical protein